MVSIPTLLRMAAVTLGSFAAGALCAAAVTRLAVRTRYFARHDLALDSWHGRPPSQTDREHQEGLNPFILTFLAFWVVFTLVMGALDALVLG